MFQGTGYCELLASTGANPIVEWKCVSATNAHANGKAPKREYKKDLKGYAYACLMNGRLQFPKDDAKGAYIMQPTLHLQLLVPPSSSFAIDLTLSDMRGNRRRLFLHPAARDWKVTPLHASVPLQLPRNAWLNLILDMSILFQRAWPSETYRSLEGLLLSGVYTLRRVTTFKQQGANIMMPAGFEYPNGLPYEHIYVGLASESMMLSQESTSQMDIRMSQVDARATLPPIKLPSLPAIAPKEARSPLLLASVKPPVVRQPPPPLGTRKPVLATTRLESLPVAPEAPDPAFQARPKIPRGEETTSRSSSKNSDRTTPRTQSQKDATLRQINAARPPYDPAQYSGGDASGSKIPRLIKPSSSSSSSSPRKANALPAIDTLQEVEDVMEALRSAIDGQPKEKPSVTFYADDPIDRIPSPLTPTWQRPASMDDQEEEEEESQHVRRSSSMSTTASQLVDTVSNQVLEEWSSSRPTSQSSARQRITVHTPQPASSPSSSRPVSQTSRPDSTGSHQSTGRPISHASSAASRPVSSSSRLTSSSRSRHLSATASSRARVEAIRSAQDSREAKKAETPLYRLLQAQDGLDEQLPSPQTRSRKSSSSSHYKPSRPTSSSSKRRDSPRDTELDGEVDQRENDESKEEEHHSADSDIDNVIHRLSKEIDLESSSDEHESIGEGEKREETPTSEQRMDEDALPFGQSDAGEERSFEETPSSDHFDEPSDRGSSISADFNPEASERYRTGSEQIDCDDEQFGPSPMRRLVSHVQLEVDRVVADMDEFSPVSFTSSAGPSPSYHLEHRDRPIDEDASILRAERHVVDESIPRAFTSSFNQSEATVD